MNTFSLSSFSQFTLLITCLMSGASAFAEGAGTRGGGDVIICKGEVSLADTYAFKNAGAFITLAGAPEEEVLKTYLAVIQKKNPALYSEISKQLAKLQFNPVKNVPELDDDFIVVPDHCRKKQLAIQNIEAGTVDYNEGLYARLSSAEKPLFKIHEAYIRSRKKPGMDTTPIRAEVATIPTDKNFIVFLADTLLKDKIFPEFYWLSVTEKLFAFYTQLGKSAILPPTFKLADFCRNLPAETIQNNLNGANALEPSLTFYNRFLQSIDYTTGNSSFAPDAAYRLAKLLGQSPNAFQIAYALQDMQLTPTWVAKKDINFAEIHQTLGLLFESCPQFVAEAKKAYADLDTYEKTVNSAL